MKLSASTERLFTEARRRDVLGRWGGAARIGATESVLSACPGVRLIDQVEPHLYLGMPTGKVLARAYEPQRALTSSSGVRNGNTPKVRFSATVGKEPEVELALV